MYIPFPARYFSVFLSPYTNKLRGYNLPELSSSRALCLKIVSKIAISNFLKPSKICSKTFNFAPLVGRKSNAKLPSPLHHCVSSLLIFSREGVHTGAVVFQSGFPVRASCSLTVTEQVSDRGEGTGRLLYHIRRHSLRLDGRHLGSLKGNLIRKDTFYTRVEMAPKRQLSPDTAI